MRHHKLLFLLAVPLLFSTSSCQSAAEETLKVSLDETSITLDIGEEKQLTPYLSKTEGVSWEFNSSNPEKVSVTNNGKVKALDGPASEKITFVATYKEKDYTAYCDVIVNEPPVEYVTVVFLARGQEVSRKNDVVKGSKLVESDFPTIPEAEGYSPNGWDWDMDTIITQYTTINAKYAPLTNTKVTIKYYAQNNEGDYVYLDSVVSSGTTDDTYVLSEGEKDISQFASKLPNGFEPSDYHLSSDNVYSLKIMNDGSTVFEIKYDTNTRYLKNIISDGDGKYITDGDVGKVGSGITAPAAFKFFDGSDNIAIFSTDITCPVDGMTDPSGARVGIIFTNGKLLGGSRFDGKGFLTSSFIGLFRCGLVTYRNYFDKGRDYESTNYRAQYCVNEDKTGVFQKDIPTNNLMLVLSQDIVYVFVNNRYVSQFLLVNDSEGLMSGDNDAETYKSSAYVSGEKFQFGIATLGTETIKIKFSNIQKYYGAEATEKIYNTDYISEVVEVNDPSAPFRNVIKNGNEYSLKRRIVGGEYSYYMVNQTDNYSYTSIVLPYEYVSTYWVSEYFAGISMIQGSDMNNCVSYDIGMAHSADDIRGIKSLCNLGKSYGRDPTSAPALAFNSSVTSYKNNNNELGIATYNNVVYLVVNGTVALTFNIDSFPSVGAVHLAKNVQTKFAICFANTSVADNPAITLTNALSNNAAKEYIETNILA